MGSIQFNTEKEGRMQEWIMLSCQFYTNSDDRKLDTVLITPNIVRSVIFLLLENFRESEKLMELKNNKRLNIRKKS